MLALVLPRVVALAAAVLALARASGVAVRFADEVVGLNHVDERLVARLCRRCRVQERVRVLDLGLELEAVTDVGLAVARVVDVDVVPRAVVEPVEVRAAGGILERDPVRDHRQLMFFVAVRGRIVLDRERVDVGVVRGGIECGERCLAVARANSERDRHCDRRESSDDR
jgi:hypothetical protein